jgi:periplasmic protein TonB
MRKEKDMFETAVLSYGPPTKRVWATFAGFTGQAALVGFALLAPLLWPQVIPKVTWAVQVVGPPPPPPPPPGPSVIPRHAKAYTQFVDNVLQQPVAIPPKALIFTEDEPVTPTGGSGVTGGVDRGPKDGVPRSPLLTDIMRQGQILPRMPVAEVRETPKPNLPPARPQPKVVRISQVTPATPIRKVDPIYPPLAKAAGISGRVELMGLLGTDGHIHELRVVSGHPLLIKAALDAVAQWIFAPTILNGQAVEVQAPIQVNFVLNR